MLFRRTTVRYHDGELNHDPTPYVAPGDDLEIPWNDRGDKLDSSAHDGEQSDEVDDDLSVAPFRGLSVEPLVEPWLDSPLPQCSMATEEEKTSRPGL